MKKIIGVGTVLLASFALNVVAQDWYHEREERYRAEHWRAHLLEEVKTDLDHVGSVWSAAERERRRLDRTREELTDLQIKLDHGRFDGGELNDVIDSLTKSANDQRLSDRDRDVLHDDTNRLIDYREHHDHWIENR